MIEDMNKVEEVCRNIGEFLGFIAGLKSFVIDDSNHKNIKNTAEKIFLNIKGVSGGDSSGKSDAPMQKDERSIMPFRQHLTYNVVLIFNEETKMFNAYIPDLLLVGEAETKKDMIADIMDYFKKLIHLVEKESIELPIPSSFDDIRKKWEKDGFFIFAVSVNLTNGDVAYADPMGTVNI